MLYEVLCTSPTARTRQDMVRPRQSVLNLCVVRHADFMRIVDINVKLTNIDKLYLCNIFYNMDRTLVLYLYTPNSDWLGTSTFNWVGDFVVWQPNHNCGVK